MEDSNLPAHLMVIRIAQRWGGKVGTQEYSELKGILNILVARAKQDVINEVLGVENLTETSQRLVREQANMETIYKKYSTDNL